MIEMSIIALSFVKSPRYVKCISILVVFYGTTYFSLYDVGYYFEQILWI